MTTIEERIRVTTSHELPEAEKAAVVETLTKVILQYLKDFGQIPEMGLDVKVGEDWYILQSVWAADSCYSLNFVTI